MPRIFGVPHSMDRPRSVALDPRGEHLAIADPWGALVVLAVKDGRVRHRFYGLEELDDGVRLVFTPDGRHLISAGHAHNILKLWSMDTGKLVREQKVDGYPIRAIAPGAGLDVAVVTSKGAEIWDLGRGLRRHLLKMPYDLPVIRVASSRTGLWAVGDRAGNVRLFSTTKAGAGAMAPATATPGGFIASPGSRLVALSLSADGALLASGFQDGLVRLHDTASVSTRRGFRFFARSPITGLGVTGKGTQIAVVEESGKVSCLEAQEAQSLASLQATIGGALALDVALSEEGTRLVLVSSDRRVTLLQGKMDGRPVLLPRDHAPPAPKRPAPSFLLVQPARILIETPGLAITSFSLDRRGQLLALGSRPTVAGERLSHVSTYYLDYRTAGAATARRIYDRTSPESDERPPKEPVWVSISSDRKWLLAQGAGFSLHRWSLISGRAIRNRRKPTFGLRGLLPTADGKTLISLSGDQVLGRSLEGAQRFRFPGLDEAYWMGTAASPGRLIMIRGWDRMTGFDLPSGVPLWSHDSGPLADYEVMAVAIPPKSRTMITYHVNGFLRRYNLDSGALLDRSRIPAPEGAQRCALRPDGRVLACGHERGIDLMEVPGGAPLGSLPPPLLEQQDRLRVRDLTFSPQGNVLVVQTGGSRLAVYSFDHAEPIAKYGEVEAKARIQLGLPITPPPLKERPSALYKPPELAPQGPLRRGQNPHSPDPGGTPRPPAPPAPSPRP